MLKTYLYQLEALTDELLRYKPDQLGSFSGFDSAEKIRYAAVVADHLKSDWLKSLFGASKDHSFRRYVQYHQRILIGLSNRTHQYINFHGHQQASEDLISYAGWLLKEIEELIKFLRQRCYPFFDSNQYISEYFAIVVSKKIQAYADEFKAFPNPQITAALKQFFISALISAAEKVADSRTTFAITGDQIKILRSIRSGLLQYPELTDEDFCFILYQQNFNIPGSAGKLQVTLEEKAENLPDTAEQNAFWEHRLEKFIHAGTDPDQSFDHHQPSLEIILTPWLRNKQLLTTGLQLSAPDISGTDDRLHLTLSVPQFALYIRLFHLSGCFSTGNISDLKRFFARHFSTKRQGTISIKSFARAFYNVDQTTAAVVLDQLKRMTDIINKTYFN